jgi:lysyl-tRNA synthetase class 1
MQWLNVLVDEIVAASPGDGEILIESGSSPSGTYHLGHLREIIICDALLLALKNRGRSARHISYIDDLDALRKIPVNVPAGYEKYLGQSLCDIPSPSGEGSYAEYFLKGFVNSAKALGIEMEVMLSSEKYRSGYFAPAIETALSNIPKIRRALEEIGGRKLDEQWSPLQINEAGYLKKRPFVSIDTEAKVIKYLDKNGQEQATAYDSGQAKLDWRIDWPARWHQLGIAVEPFGRDHATKGGSYDTGAVIIKEVFGSSPPIPVAYDFVNMAGDTKKMSASKGTGLDAENVVKVLPPEIVRFFMLRYPPSKRLYFDPINGVSQLIDDFAQLMNEQPDSQLVEFSRRGTDPVVSRVPFSHLVASYQAALKDQNRTLEVIARTEHGYSADQNRQILEEELKYIDQWLNEWAPEDVKFDLKEAVRPDDFSDSEKQFLSGLADKIAESPADADGEWFHKAIYEFKDSAGLSPKELFTTLYRLLIGKDSGPRAGWFLSILPRDWLIARLRFEG